MKIKEFKENCLIDDVFLISSVVKGVTNKNTPYASLVLQDKTGNIEAKKWDLTFSDEDSLKVGNFVRVEGSVIEYKDKLQMKLTNCELVDPSKVNKADFINCSPTPIEDLEKKLDEYIEKVEDTNLHSLTKEIISRKRGAFVNGVAATKIHHDFIGGLLFHTISMCGFAEKICDHLKEMYPNEPINKSLLLAGCILHDIGKTEEIESNPVSKYTEKGLLLGHISIGYSIISKTAEELNLSGCEQVILLEHMILSHHGKQEYGSPVTPMFKEAFLLSMIDEMDSKVNFIDKIVDDLDEGDFSPKQFAFDNRSLYKPKKK